MLGSARNAARLGRGYFAAGIWQPKREVNVGSLLRSAWLYGAALVFTVGARYHQQSSDTTKTLNQIPLVHCPDLDDLIEHLPHGCPLVGVEMDEAAYPLRGYVHPARATYLFGSEVNGLPAEVMKRCHELVRIESHRPVSLNVACAGSIVLYDRYAKASESKGVGG